MVQVTQTTFPPPPPLLSAYPFMDSLHPFMSIFPICDMCSRIWNRRSDYVDFVNLCLFSAYLGTRSLKTFRSLVILILNYLNFSFWSVVYVKLQVISSFLPPNVTDLKYVQWLKSPKPFKKWAVKVTHPTPLRLCMHGILVIRTITWLYRFYRLY